MNNPSLERRLKAFLVLGQVLGKVSRALGHSDRPAKARRQAGQDASEPGHFPRPSKARKQAGHPAAGPARSSCRKAIPDVRLCTEAAEKDLFRAALEASDANPWFSLREICRALDALAHMLGPEPLRRWLSSYPGLWNKDRPGSLVGLIMAGNIPLVGFHDMLCVLIAGHRLIARPSLSDSILPAAMVRCLARIDDEVAARMQLSETMDERVTAVIATGSDNTARYFLHQYAHLPHIIRKNRNSLAILTGDESPEELHKLGEDVFSYYGLGCRSVSHLLIPERSLLDGLTEAWEDFGYVLQNQAYANNIRHYQALYRVEGTPFQRRGPSLLKESRVLASPPSVLNYTLYKGVNEVEAFVREHQHQLQCVVCAGGERWPGIATLAPGTSQYPEPDDYADGIDTLQFLLDL